MKEQIEKMKETALAEINKAQDITELNNARVKYLGKKGELTAILRGMKDLSAEERPVTGSLVNVVKAELEKQNKNIPIYMCEDLKQTVTIAKKIAKPGQVVLFSPASASFDLFKNFADRGEKFKKLVNEL